MNIINKITIEPGAGCYIESLQRLMFDLSREYRCDVEAKFNGSVLNVSPSKKD